MSDRKMIKWQPFNSIMDTYKITNDINNKKNLITNPALSEDQLYDIELAIRYSIKKKIKIKITYLYNGNILCVEDFIFKIDIEKKRIVFNNNSPIYFHQIINVILS